MFPPSSPMMERVRSQSELQELEKRAMWNAQFQPTRRWRFPKLFSFRRLNADKRTTATIHPVSAEGTCY